MMPPRWQCCLSVLLGLLTSSFAYADHSFENTAVVRTVELGGSLVQVTTTYAVKALEDDVREYTIALGKREHERASWLEAKLKGQASILPLAEAGYDIESDVQFYTIVLPEKLKTNETTNIVVETVETRATYPWPEQASQQDPQSLKYVSDLFVLSPYRTLIERTKIRSPSPTIHSYSTPNGLDEFTYDAPVTKSGTTITYGPFNNIPPTSTEDFLKEKQREVAVHYGYDSSVIEIMHLQRTAEISHWGGNLNIEDKIDLHNAGPTLKGHFSRLEHQAASFYSRPPAHVIPSVTFYLPAGIHSAYYYDLIGNVSTSHLRTSPSQGKGGRSQYSVLELRPRYPLMGGWNYSFTVGWDSPLADYAGFDRASGKYIVGVPLTTMIPGAAVDEEELKIILPEGATEIDFVPPFTPSDSQIVTHITYLDTVGRPAVVLHYGPLTHKHAGLVFVTYKVPISAHLKKPLAVATAFMALFILGFVIKRTDIRIQKK